MTPTPMIIVTGTKRSGTSMWMQILTEAGFPPFGEAFPGNWNKTLKNANPDGFYESLLRQGIYWRTNPHPQSGAYFHPKQVTRHVVKVFIPGLVRTDLAYIGKVVATVRHWREYQRSLERLYAMEDQTRAPGVEPPPRMPPWLEWWDENFALVRDLLTRRYAFHVTSYDRLLSDPRGVITKVLKWLGDPQAKVEPAVAAVHPDNRTQHRPELEGVPEHLATVFDALYRAIDEQTGIDRPLLETLNETNRELTPTVLEHRRAIAQARRQRRRPPGEGPDDASDPSLDDPDLELDG